MKPWVVFCYSWYRSFRIKVMFCYEPLQITAILVDCHGSVPWTSLYKISRRVCATSNASLNCCFEYVEIFTATAEKTNYRQLYSCGGLLNYESSL